MFVLLEYIYFISSYFIFVAIFTQTIPKSGLIEKKHAIYLIIEFL